MLRHAMPHTMPCHDCLPMLPAAARLRYEDGYAYYAD